MKIFFSVKIEIIMQYSKAPEIHKQISYLVKELKLYYINPKQIHCIRSYDAKTRAYARVWGMSKLFKEVVGNRATL
jgi:predicted metallopeptidase